MLVDHCLRSGYYETAIKLAKDSQIEVGLKQSRVVYLKKKVKTFNDWKTCICMSLRALHLHTCTCSHSLNYIFMGWISCCVLMHFFNILITLIFFYYFQGIRGHWIIPGLKESRRVIVEEGNWALSSLVLWKQIQTKKIQGRCIVYFIKKNCNCVNCFLDAY